MAYDVLVCHGHVFRIMANGRMDTRTYLPQYHIIGREEHILCSNVNAETAPQHLFLPMRCTPCPLLLLLFLLLLTPSISLV